MLIYYQGAPFYSRNVLRTRLQSAKRSQTTNTQDRRLEEVLEPVLVAGVTALPDRTCWELVANQDAPLVSRLYRRKTEELR